jgi:hypothetical protein
VNRKREIRTRRTPWQFGVNVAAKGRTLGRGMSLPGGLSNPAWKAKMAG